MDIAVHIFCVVVGFISQCQIKNC